MKMQRTIIIRRDYLHFIKKYGRFEKRHTVSFYQNYLTVFKSKHKILKIQEVWKKLDLLQRQLSVADPIEIAFEFKMSSHKIKNMAVHLSPCFRDVELGDLVTVGECRPLSKTVRFNVVKHSKPPGAKKQFSKF